MDRERIAKCLQVFAAGFAICIAAIFWLSASTWGQSVMCPADTPSGDQVVNDLLTQLTPELNAAWPDLAKQLNIDPLQPVYSGQVNVGCEYGGDEICGVQLAACDSEYLDLDVKTLYGLANLRFSDLEVVALNGVNVSAHSNPGADASLITDGAYAPEGTSFNDRRYAVRLPGPNYPLTVDLGKIVNVCATSPCLPTIQANAPDQYDIDYSTDGMTWKPAPGYFAAVSDGNLRTRTMTSYSGIAPQPTFSARFVRVYGDFYVNDGNDFAISQLELHDYNAQSSSPISVGARALGPQPSQIVDGDPPPNGTAWDDLRAVVLAKEGPAHALVIDLGSVMDICANYYDCLAPPLIQADQNDVYQLGYSTDGVNWTDLDQLPTASGAGLQTRNLGSCNLRPDPNSPCSSTNHDPNFTARYVRIWAVQGDGAYSVSQVELWSVGGKLVSTNKPTYGPEPLVTNGEFAPEGTAWDDNRYATVLPGCTDAKQRRKKKTGECSWCDTVRNKRMPRTGSRCVTSSAQSAVASIDLGASFPISQIKLQANSYGVYQVDVSEDRVLWSPLWTAPTDSNGNLRTRVSPLLKNTQGRYLRVYGTSYATPGQTLYSVSELEVETPQARTSCPYDSAADAGEDFSCTYGGQFEGDAYLPSSAEISGYVDRAQVKAECDLFGTGVTWTETLGDAGTIWCYMENTTGSAQANFCAGTCSDATPIPSTMSYAQVASLKISAPQVSCNASDVPQWLTDIVVPEIKDELIKAVTPPITSALNDLLQEFVPFPGICSAERDPASLNLFPATQKSPDRVSEDAMSPFRPASHNSDSPFFGL